MRNIQIDDLRIVVSNLKHEASLLIMAITFKGKNEFFLEVKHHLKGGSVALNISFENPR